MKEHRCPKCNKLLFKYSDDGEVTQGKIEIETQHHCKSEDKAKVKDVKTFDN
jgi:phage FluMu protein Com